MVDLAANHSGRLPLISQCAAPKLFNYLLYFIIINIARPCASKHAITVVCLLIRWITDL